MNHEDLPPLPERPATLKEIVVALEGYRVQLSDFAERTDANMARLREQLQARIDLARAFK